MCSIDEHLGNCWQAVADGMGTVKSDQLIPPGVRKAAELKAEDNTLITTTDKLSAEYMSASVPPGCSLLIEDGVNRETGSDEIYIGDPLDGTGAFAAGLSTSTVVMAVYSRSKKQLVCSAAGIPATGQIWLAVWGQPTYARHSPFHPTDLVTTWQGELGRSGKAIVFLDVSHGFKNKVDGGMVLDDEQMGRLINSLRQEAKVLIPGSNILIQAMVANGGEGAAGCIMTAKGGPQDMCAVLQVVQAGGAAAAFRAINGVLREADPLDVMDGNILICANSHGTLDRLTEMVRSLF